MTADPVGDDVLARLAGLWADILRDGDEEGGIVSTPAEAFTDALVRMDLAVVPRAQTVPGDTPVTHGPAVTLAVLFDKATSLVDQHQHDQAAVLLDVIDTYGRGNPFLSAYRAFVDVLTELDRAGIGSDDDVWRVEKVIRQRVRGLLTGAGPVSP